MTNSLRLGAMTLALLGTVGIALAQAPPSPTPGGPTPGGAPGAPGTSQSTSPNQKVQLSATQKTAIYNAVSKDKSKSAAPANFQPSIGAKVPASLELHALPPEALANAQAASSYRYTTANNQVVLVDPLTMQVVDIIRQ